MKFKQSPQPQLSKLKISREITNKLSHVEVLKAFYIYKDERNKDMFIAWMVERNKPDFYMRMDAHDVFTNIKYIT